MLRLVVYVRARFEHMYAGGVKWEAAAEKSTPRLLSASLESAPSYRYSSSTFDGNGVVQNEVVSRSYEYIEQGDSDDNSDDVGDKEYVSSDSDDNSDDVGDKEYVSSN